MNQILGLVRDGKFGRIPDDKGVLENLRITTIDPQVSTQPESAEITLDDLEGKMITVEGVVHGQWIYSAKLVSSQFFRANVGIVLINKNGEVLALERCTKDCKKGSGQWQMSQGGLDDQEDPRKSAERELLEEVGIEPKHVKFLDEHPDWLVYELPKKDRKAAKHGRGQAQKWFLYRFKGDESDIDLARYAKEHNDECPEFCDRKWMSLNQLAKEVWEVRRSIYEKLASYFQEYLKN